MPRVCTICKLPREVQDAIAEQHRRDVPLRTIADGLREMGHPVHRDVIWRHCSKHLVAESEYGPEGSSSPTALAVAVIVSRALAGWPRLLSDAAAALRDEGLYAVADVLVADVPQDARKYFLELAPSPGSELLEARVLVQALRKTIAGGAFPDFNRALTAALLDQGAYDLADAVAYHLSGPATSLTGEPETERA